jgi:hypothetical protein
MTRRCSRSRSAGIARGSPREARTSSTAFRMASLSEGLTSTRATPCAWASSVASRPPK